MKSLISVLLLFTLIGCADRDEYYKAHQQRESSRQLYQEKAERQRAYEREQLELKRMAHRERMSVLSAQALAAAAATENKIDDVLVPYHLASLEDKWAIADLLAETRTSAPVEIKYDHIEAPEKPSEYARIGANLLLGGGALYLGIQSSNNLKDVAVAGINSAGNHFYGDGNINDSYKTGTDNTLYGEGNSVTSGDAGTCDDCEEEDPTEMPKTCSEVEGSFIDEDGYLWVSPDCSCNSYLAGHCS